MGTVVVGAIVVVIAGLPSEAFARTRRVEKAAMAIAEAAADATKAGN